jgi:hypothetical protein
MKSSVHGILGLLLFRFGAGQEGQQQFAALGDFTLESGDTSKIAAWGTERSVASTATSQMWFSFPTWFRGNRCRRTASAEPVQQHGFAPAINRNPARRGVPLALIPLGGEGGVMVAYKPANPDGERDTEASRAESPTRFRLTCSGCGFVLVTATIDEATVLGWRVILPEQHRGLCPNCARNI